MPKFRSAYDFGDTAEYGLNFGDESSLTIQSAKDECDINLIVERAERGMYPEMREKIPQFGDFSETPDYQSALNYVIAAQERFSELPARVRERFGNNAGILLAFLADPANRDEAVQLGLVNAPPVPAPLDPGAPVEPA